MASRLHAILPVAAMILASPAQAQSLGNVIKRSAEKEAKRQAERRTREAVQCATGARDCTPDKEAANAPPSPELTRAPVAGAASAPAPAAAGSGDPADAYLIPSGTAAAPEIGRAAGIPFAVAPIPGARATDNSGPGMAGYRRITGFKPKQISYQDQTGLLTRSRYELTGGQTASAMIAAWREPLLRQGFSIEWQCSRKAQCGSSAYHQLGAGYMPVNGINLGIAGDVEYFTARRAIQGQPTVYVAIALNRKVAYVDVLEVTP